MTITHNYFRYKTCFCSLHHLQELNNIRKLNHLTKAASIINIILLTTRIVSQTVSSYNHHLCIRSTHTEYKIQILTFVQLTAFSVAWRQRGWFRNFTAEDCGGHVGRWRKGDPLIQQDKNTKNLIFPIKAATSNFHLLLILATPMDKLVRASTPTVVKILVWPALAFVLEESEIRTQHIFYFPFCFCF